MKTKKLGCLKIGALNCHGLRDKIDYPEVHQLISSFDIFGVTETWLEHNDDIHIDGFKFYPLNRKKTKDDKGSQRGGIGIFIKNDLKEHVKLQDNLSCENFFGANCRKTISDSMMISTLVLFIFHQKALQERRGLIWTILVISQTQQKKSHVKT